MDLRCSHPVGNKNTADDGISFWWKYINICYRMDNIKHN